jgi:hypothetical protein
MGTRTFTVVGPFRPVISCGLHQHAQVFRARLHGGHPGNGTGVFAHGCGRSGFSGGDQALGLVGVDFAGGQHLQNLTAIFVHCNSSENERRNQNERNPEQKERQPQTRHAEMRRFDLEDCETGNHLRASNAWMASAGAISPFWSRARISVRFSERVGEGLVSTNSNWLEMRFRRALMVG